MPCTRRAVGLMIVVLACGVGCSGGWQGGSISSYCLDGDRRLVVNGHCNDQGRVRVTEHDSSKVVLQMEVEGSRKGDCLVCPAVELDDALGDRTVFDAQTGETVPLDLDTC